MSTSSYSSSETTTSASLAEALMAVGNGDRTWNWKRDAVR